ncbi:zinc finger protein 706 [Garra rufa]|uniref:zinc finger protein 706 n=1 Tax=Garra rufa TaxID=137080 RepID=UPI003CCEB47B
MSLSSAQRRCGHCRNYTRVALGRAQLSKACRSTLYKLIGANGSRLFASMARGHQKIQSQQKNAKKQAEAKKSKGHDQKTAAKAALVFTCGVCRSQMPDPKTFKQHFESKHPKSPLPPELEGVEA